MNGIRQASHLFYSHPVKFVHGLIGLVARGSAFNERSYTKTVRRYFLFKVHALHSAQSHTDVKPIEQWNLFLQVRVTFNRDKELSKDLLVDNIHIGLNFIEWCQEIETLILSSNSAFSPTMESFLKLP